MQSIKELKQLLLKEIKTHTQLAEAAELANESISKAYNNGYKTACLNIHRKLVIYFDNEESKT
jgi:hypothetical protein